MPRSDVIEQGADCVAVNLRILATTLPDVTLGLSPWKTGYLGPWELTPEA